MNTVSRYAQRTYGSAIRSLAIAAAAILCIGAASITSSCSGTGGLKIPAVLPFDIGVKYQIEPGLFVVATPADKGGLDVKFEGTGALGNHVVFDGQAWTVTSPATGIVYKITPGATGVRPKIEIIGGGNGKLQLVPKTPPPSDPVLTQPAPPAPDPLEPPAAVPVA